MSRENRDSFTLEDDNESLDLGLNSNDHQTRKIEDNQWIIELRVALERGCDLGAIRNIAQCRPLTDDLRLRVWKVRQSKLNSI